MGDLFSQGRQDFFVDSEELFARETLYTDQGPREVLTKEAFCQHFGIPAWLEAIGEVHSEFAQDPYRPTLVLNRKDGSGVYFTLHKNGNAYPQGWWTYWWWRIEAPIFGIVKYGVSQLEEEAG